MNASNLFLSLILHLGNLFLIVQVHFCFFQAEDGIRDLTVTGVQTCALPISSWSASGGTITSGGLYAADTVDGTYQVNATAQVATTAPAAATPANTRASGSSTVKNTGPLTQVILTPATASVLVGGTLQFEAYARRKNGDSTSVSVVYAATGVLSPFFLLAKAANCSVP